MKLGWLNGIKDSDRKKEIRQSFESSVVMRKRMLEILERKMRESWVASIDEKGYDTPNWAYKQADARGYERAMREIMSLIK